MTEAALDVLLLIAVVYVVLMLILTLIAANWRK